jgi:hypothetical protein
MEELEYVSSSADMLPTQRDVKPQDEADMPALERVAALFATWEDNYSRIDQLSAYDPKLSVDQQLLVNQAVTNHLRQLKQLVDTTINDVKEKYKNG